MIWIKIYGWDIHLILLILFDCWCLLIWCHRVIRFYFGVLAGLCLIGRGCFFRSWRGFWRVILCLIFRNVIIRRFRWNLGFLFLLAKGGLIKLGSILVRSDCVILLLVFQFFRGTMMCYQLSFTVVSLVMVGLFCYAVS